MQQVSVGRIVHYHPVDLDYRGKPWAAIVSRVLDGPVDLLVIHPVRGPMVRLQVVEGTEPGQWSWPVYVKPEKPAFDPSQVKG